jgi:hypothetical protein
MHPSAVPAVIVTPKAGTPADANLTEFGPGKIHPTWIAWTKSDAFTMVGDVPPFC